MPMTMPNAPRSTSAPLVDVSALRESIMAEVNASLVAAIRDALAQIRLNVPVPDVSVAAPNITVDVPDITIPESTIVLQVPGIDKLSELVAANTAQMAALEKAMLATEHMTVERAGPDHLIQSTTTTRTP